MSKDETLELIAIVEDALENAEGELAELEYGSQHRATNAKFAFYRSTVADKVAMRRNILKELKIEPA